MRWGRAGKAEVLISLIYMMEIQNDAWKTEIKK